MADVKWIKITTNMFDDEKIKLIESLPEKDSILIIWIKLLAQAGKTNASGYIFLNENIPYTDEMLATIFNRPLNTVRLALETFRRFGMIEMDDRGIYISNWEKHQNLDKLDKIKEQNRLRKQNQRSREKELMASTKEELGVSELSHVTVTGHHAIELEEELEEEKDFSSSCSSSEMIPMDVVFSLYKESGFGDIDNTTKEILISYTNQFTVDWVVQALQECHKRNKKTLKYLEGILNNWKKEGAIKLKKDNSGKQQGKQSNNSPKNKFHNFEQRTTKYSKEELEQILLGKNTS